jgi:excinuclease ABC subunit C
MIGLIDDVETIIVDNEIEALMLEATLIKDHLPKFNIKLTDDKAYPYIKLSKNEPISRLSVVRKRIGDKARYFGPYLSAKSAHNTLEFLRDLYGIHISPIPLKHRQRACFNCQLSGQPCVLADEISEEAYYKKVELAVSFLTGKQKNIIREIEQQMNDAAMAENFELAAKLRDRLSSMKNVMDRQQVISSSLEDYDAIGIYRAIDQASINILHIRDGRVSGQHSFFLTTTSDETDESIVRQFILSVYSGFSTIPPLIATPHSIQDQEKIAELLTEKFSHSIKIREAQRGEKHDLVELATKNAQSKLETKLLRTDQSLQALISLQELLELPELPHRIEAVDISNLGSSETVGATVCFINGKPDKNEYRRYKIKTVEGQNDFAMIREVTARRFHDMERPVPDLFIVDGGTEQLKSALEGIELSPRSPKYIISLAKKPDRIFLPGRKMPLSTTRGNKGLLLLSRIRDEVHRFVITYQRNRQRRKSLHE